jgi:ABC-2 type transport system ATP-binding protein
MSTLAIEATGLVKSFGATRALDGFDLAVPAGQVTGFLGPNGSGKSTAIRVLPGMLRADSGTARVLGQDAWRDQVAIHRRVAYVPGDTSLWPNLAGGEAIDVLARLRGNGQDRARRDELLARFELDPTKKSRTYSKGNRQKVSLVAALASEAELFLLDEPTSGLDPLMEACSPTRSAPCATSPGPRSRPRRRPPPGRSAACRSCTTWWPRTAGCASTSTTPT